MKRGYLAPIFGAAIALCFSCGEGDNDNSISIPGGDDIQSPVVPSTPNKDEVMSATAQKEYLEEVALEFINQVPSSDFRKLSSLGQYIQETYIDDYNWDNVENWADDILDELCAALGTTTTETDTENWSGTTYNYINIYQNYESILYASNFTGHFTASNGKWIYDEADDLKFIFADNNDKECVLSLQTSGASKKVYAFNIDDWQDSDYESNGNNYTYHDYYDRTQYTIGVPEKVTITLTQNGSDVVRTVINTDLNSLVGEDFDISKSEANFSAELELNNGYKFVMSQMAYDANSEFALSFAMVKNGVNMVTAAVTSDISGIPSCNLDAFSSDFFDIDDYDTDNANAKTTYAKVDILGKVQVQGTVSNVRKYVDNLDDAYDNDESESSFKSYVNMANGLMDVNLFYNNTYTKQATVKWEAFADETYYGTTYWDTEMILNFYDGTSYSTFEAFFNDNDFKSVIDSFEDLVEKYEDLID